MDAEHNTVNSDQYQTRNPSAAMEPLQQLTRLRMAKNKQLVLCWMTLLLVLTRAGAHAVSDAMNASSDTMITIGMSSEDSRYACNRFLHIHNSIDCLQAFVSNGILNLSAFLRSFQAFVGDLHSSLHY